MHLQKLLEMTAPDDEGEEGSPNSSAGITQKSAFASWSKQACWLGRDRTGSEGHAWSSEPWVARKSGQSHGGLLSPSLYLFCYFLTFLVTLGEFIFLSLSFFF